MAYLARVTPEAPSALLDRTRQWEHLSRWERSELGRDLRRLGWTYGEIMEVLPVAKGTLAGWCRDIRLREDQVAAIKRRRPPGVRTGIPIDTQRKRRLEVERLRHDAQAYAAARLDDAFFVAGVVMYWAEGAKTTRRLSLAHSEPAALRLFVSWVTSYLKPSPRVALQLFIHADNDLDFARDWWLENLALDNGYFTKPFIKPDGTGHRKNHLPHGVCRAQIARSTDSFFRTMAFIDVIRRHLGSGSATAILPTGR
jgi:hypothetical protein